ncbi:MAG: fumarate/nitrate reduction transcriptional regulator Fnr [Gammaproteobacteria bacterium]|nr:MAG: fumarate/nitrate reduction transcriptional regulator Fnr [Gammaproteobacteria bacterium]
MGQRIASTATALSNDCAHCNLGKLCMPIAVSSEELEQLNDVIQQGRVFDRGDHIFYQDDAFTSCFAVKSGSIKTYTVSEDGEEQVTGFYLPGEILALDSVSMDRYTSCAVALERSSVCEIPLEKLEQLASVIPSLQHHFFQLMSQEIRGSRELAVMLSRNSAEERLASMFVALSKRNERRHLSPYQFRLPMARADLGNYLGLAVETVSRLLTRFAKQGLMDVRGREVTIHDLEGLKAVVTHQTECRHA